MHLLRAHQFPCKRQPRLAATPLHGRQGANLCRECGRSLQLLLPGWAWQQAPGEALLLSASIAEY